MATTNGRIAVAWYDKESQVAESGYQAKLGLWTADGKLLWKRTLSSSGSNGRIPVVVADGNRFFCAWLEENGEGDIGIWSARLDLDGQLEAPPQRMAPAGPTTWNLSAAVDGRDRVWVAFDASVDTSSDEIYLVGTDEDDGQVRRLTDEDGASSKYPSIAFNSDRVALTWWDERDGNREVYLYVGPQEHLPPTLDGVAHRITKSEDESIGAYAAWNGDRLGVAWSDTDEGHFQIYFQAFDASGKPLESARRLTQNDKESLIPAIVAADDRFALAWNEDVAQERLSHAIGGRSAILFANAR